MAPLAAGAAIAITQCFSSTRILVTRGASHSDASGDSSEHNMKDKWLFAPILIFMLIVVLLLWLMCFASKTAKNDVKRKRKEAMENVKSLVQDLPAPRPWGSGSNRKICDGKSAVKSAPAAESDEPGEEVCAICLETFVSADTVRQMRACDHVFHQQCFEDWLVQHRSNLETCKRELRCPICRRIIMEAVEGVRLAKPADAYFGF